MLLAIAPDSPFIPRDTARSILPFLYGITLPVFIKTGSFFEEFLAKA